MQDSVQENSGGDDRQFNLSELLARVRTGDRHAESLIFNRYSRGVMFLLRTRTDNDIALAQDLHQETFSIVVVKMRDGQVRKPESLSAFIRQVAVNVLIEHFRRLRRRGEFSDERVVGRSTDLALGPSRRVEVDQLAEVVRKMVAELPVPRDRQLLRRYYLDQVSKPRICAELDLSSEHFDRVIYRAKLRLRQLINDNAASGGELSDYVRKQ